MQTQQTVEAAGASTPQRLDAGVEMSLRIGQHVRHRDYDGRRVTGVIRGLVVDSDRVLQADIVLDEPIIIPARTAEDHDLRLYWQHVPACELAAFDHRDELITDMLAALRGCAECFDSRTPAPVQQLAAAAIAKATGSGA